MSKTKVLLSKFKASNVAPSEKPKGIIPINCGSGGKCDHNHNHHKVTSRE